MNQCPLTLQSHFNTVLVVCDALKKLHNCLNSESFALLISTQSGMNVGFSSVGFTGILLFLNQIFYFYGINENASPILTNENVSPILIDSCSSGSFKLHLIKLMALQYLISLQLA
jgi:hypothetical protein